jgi:DNA repair protein RecN (Recombination protein N)
LLERLESARIELVDILDEASSFSENVVPDESRINTINELLSMLYHLQKKHGAEHVEDLIALRNSLSDKISTAENFNERIEILRSAAQVAESDLEKIASKITSARKESARQVEKETTAYFKKLGLIHARFEITIAESKEYNPLGRNEINMLFSANKGSELQPVQAVASGGEISRVMLALKAAISHYRELPTLILDEIDQGISGQTAVQTGTLMKEMSAQLQVISITHLPQIAGKADHHFKVYKVAGKNETLTHIRNLELNDRINELAEMLSGKEISGAALENAKELLKE